jgi:hypothetical protein
VATFPQLRRLTSAQFPTEVFNVANYLPPDDWFAVITSMFPPGLT